MVSLVATVLNEAGSIQALLESVCRQTRLPDEVILVDGGSADCTIALARAFERRLPLRVLHAPGSTIAMARNHGIEAARGEIIAMTDAGVRLAPGWLDALAGPLERGESEVSAGFFTPDPRTVFERALASVTLPEEREINPLGFLPSSRSVAFSRSAWTAAGGYPEWLDYCEDLVFDLELRKRGIQWLWRPEAVAHFRPRPDVESFILQYYRYARGDGKAGLWGRRHVVRYAAYLVLLSAAAAPVRSPLVWLLLGLGSAAYLRGPFSRLLPHLSGLSFGERLRVLALLPLLRGVGDVAKMVGYPVGVSWRLRRRRRRC